MEGSGDGVKNNKHVLYRLLLLRKHGNTFVLLYFMTAVEINHVMFYFIVRNVARQQVICIMCIIVYKQFYYFIFLHPYRVKKTIPHSKWTLLKSCYFFLNSLRSIRKLVHDFKSPLLDVETTIPLQIICKQMRMPIELYI